MRCMVCIRVVVCAVVAALVAFVCPCVALGAVEITTQDVDTLVSRVDKLLADRENLMATRRALIGSLTQTARDKYTVDAMRTVSRAYIGYNTDSAIVYAHRAILLAEADSGDVAVLKAEMASMLPMVGQVTRAERFFASADTSSMSTEQLMDYYAAGIFLYHNMLQLYFRYPGEEERYRDMRSYYRSRILATAPEEMRDSPMFRLTLGGESLERGDLDRAEMLLEDVAEMVEPGSVLASRAAVLLADIMKQRGDRTSYIYYLLRASTNDLIAGNTEVPTLFVVGKEMLADGRADIASRYFKAAVYDDSQAHDVLSLMTSGRYVPSVVQSYEENISSLKAVVGWILVAVIVLVALLVAVFVAARRYKVSRDRTKLSLDAIMGKRDVDLVRFIELCTASVSKMSQFARSVESKIRNGKADEVARLIRSNKFATEQTNDFFKVFDKAFLHLYPDFLASVNALMLPEHQIVLDGEQEMNNDLRILAFMRLGIYDTGQIAQMMGYSVNTVYAYRTRLRNRSKNKETFEEDIRTIPMGGGETA